MTGLLTSGAITGVELELLSMNTGTLILSVIIGAMGYGLIYLIIKKSFSGLIAGAITTLLLTAAIMGLDRYVEDTKSDGFQDLEQHYGISLAGPDSQPLDNGDEVFSEDANLLSPITIQSTEGVMDGYIMKLDEEDHYAVVASENAELEGSLSEVDGESPGDTGTTDTDELEEVEGQ